MVVNLLGRRVIHMSGHTERQWEGKFFRCGMRCFYCHTPLTLLDATKDHLTPVSRGGSDKIDNIVPACIDCNQRKGKMTETEYRAAFLTAFQQITATTYPNSESAFDRIDADWDKIRRESESPQASWAWRHPR